MSDPPSSEFRPFRYRARLRRAAEIWGVPPPVPAPDRARPVIPAALAGSRLRIVIPGRGAFRARPPG